MIRPTRGATGSCRTPNQARRSRVVPSDWSRTGRSVRCCGSSARTPRRPWSRSWSSVRGRRHLELRVTLDWHQRLALLKLRFPVAARRPDRDLRDPVRASRPSGRRRRGTRADLGRRHRRPAQRRAGGTDGRQRCQVGLRREQRTRLGGHRHHRRPESRVRLARASRAGHRRRLQLPGPGPAGVPVPARPARRRLADGRGAAPVRRTTATAHSAVRVVPPGPAARFDIVRVGGGRIRRSRCAQTGRGRARAPGGARVRVGR